MANLNRVVWEGWTVQNFIDDLYPLIDMVMSGESFIKPFKTKSEMIKFIKENQPYYKKSIPEVNDYFIKKYGLGAK
jgi:hypothetical protein